MIAFVGKAAYEGTFRERPELGLQERRFPSTLLYVLPSTSPANAAVPYDERLRWFSALRQMLEPAPRHAVRAAVVDARDRLLLYRFVSPGGVSFWATPGGGIEAGESEEEAMRRELGEEVGLHDVALGPCIWERTDKFIWRGVNEQVERFYLVRVESHDVRQRSISRRRAWRSTAGGRSTSSRTRRTRSPRAGCPSCSRSLLADGPPRAPVDAGR